MIDITFTVNRYESDGAEIDHGVFLHFGETSIKVGDKIAEIGLIGEQLRKIAEEVGENYRD